jgi:hypothetical protein
MTQQDPRLASYSKWLIANQDRRDTPEFQKVANAYKQIRANSLSQPQPQTTVPASEKGDISMGTAFDIATGQAESAATGGLATAQRLLSEGAFGKAQKYLTENYGNPVREFVGLRPVDVDAVNKAEAERLQTLSDTAAEYADQKAEETGFYNMTTGDINSLSDFVNFVGQKSAQAGAYMAPSLASGAAPISLGLNYAFGTGEISSNLKEIEGKTQAEKDQIAASGGAIVAALEQLGIAKLLPSGASNSLIGGIASGMITEGTTEGLQELVNIGSEYVAGKELTEGEILERLKESVAAGGVVGGTFKGGTTAAVKVQGIFRSDGTIVDPESLSSQEKRAAADVARMLRTVAGTDGYNLKDVSTGDKSAKAALEAVRGQIVQNIKNLSSLDGIRERLDPKKAASLDQLLEQINPATSAVAAGKTKVARSVTEEQFAAIKRLLPPTKEAGELLNALRMSNITTELFQKGQKGGISQYTDVFLPTKMDGGYSISRGIQNAAFGPAAFLTDGTTLGIGVGGRVIDKVTGRRSIIDRFVRKNENKDGLADPGGPSLLALKELQKKLEQQQLDASKQETLELNRALYDEGVDPAGLDGTMDKASPEAQMMLSLEVNTPDGRFGPDRTTINSAVQAIIDNPDSPKALVKAAEAYLTNIRDGGKIPKLTPLIQAVKREINSNPEVYGRTRASQLSQGPAFISSSSPKTATSGDGGSVNYDITSSPAYQAGIQRNITRVDNQRALLNANPTIPAVEKAQLNESLNRLRQPLTNPVVAVQQEIQRLSELGVDPASIDLVLSPIQEAVTSQQRQAQGLQTPTESTQRPALETVTPTPAEAQTESPAALTQPAPSDPVSMTVRANLLTRTVREIAEGNMTPSQVEILLSQLEQSYPGIKAEVEAIIGSQQQQQQQPAALEQPSALQLTPEMRVQPPLQLTPEMRQSAEAPSVNNTQPVLPYMQQETVEDDTKFDMEPPALPALSSDRLTMNFTDVTKRTPELQEGQRKLQSGEITRDEYADLVNKFKPVLPYQTAPAPATVQDAKYALANGKGQSDKKAEKYGEPTKVLQPDQRIQLRLDIPSYNQHGTWVVSVHEPNSRPDSTAEGRFKAGPVIGYESAMAIKNADLGMLQRPAQKIAEGSPKGTIATMLGDYMPMSPSEAQAYQQNAIEQSLQPGSGFAQVGMDPERHSYFYDRNTMQPIVSAEEIVQVGPLVIAKNPQYAPADDFVFDQEPPALQMPEIVRGETTNIMMPNDLGSAFTFARDNNFRTGRDLKLELQQRSLDRQKEEGIDLTQVNEENVPRLADHVFNDAIEALKNNENAIGWYDRTVTKALETLGEIYPEILTNPENKLQFIWALAVTSNGTKVDKNFELAADAYDHLQRTGRFPAKIGIGTAAKAINGGLAQYHTMLTKFQGDHQALADFMIGQLPVRDVEQQYGVKISGEGKDTLVRGASVLGPKIGNGFFANLYGHFDALTMDRWLMRTVGRMRGSLVKVNRPMVKQKQSEMGDIISNASTDQLKQLRAYLKPSGIPVTKNMSMQQKNDLAAYIARQSTDKSWREGLNNISNDMRLVGNALALYLDGQVEAPAGAKERTFIRDVFKQALDRLNDDPRISRVSNAGLTMSDLQALLWYPEKRLYDTAKAPAGEESRGYSDDEAPDYANAARKLVEARKAMVVGSGLGPSSGDGPRGRGPALADAGRTADDREPGLLPALREGRDKLGAKFSRRPQRQEVVDQFPPVKALFEIGKKGSPYENGITNLDQALELARALNITVHLFDNQQKMMEAQGRENKGTVRGSFRKAPNGASGTVFALKAGSTVNEGTVGSLDELTTVLHEIFHGVTMGPMSGVGPMINGNGTNSVENALGAMIDKPQGKRTREEREIMYEVKRLQDQLAAYIEGNPRDRRSVRVLNRALQNLEENRMRMTPEQQMQQEQAIDNYKNYIRTKSEFSVDPFWVYAVNPKLAKQVMPVTTKWIQKNLRQAGNKNIQFYSHPFAVSVAVMLAILAAQDAEDEEKKQQQQPMMPQGALSPMPGMLTAA